MSRHSHRRRVVVSDHPPSFFRRNRGLILTTTFVVFFLCVLVTLFQAPVFRATDYVAVPAGSDYATEHARLTTPEVLEILRKNNPNVYGPEKDDYKLFLTQTDGGIALSIEGTDPSQISALADMWANVYAQQTASAGRGMITVHHSEIPDVPVRPKKARGLLVGLILGFLLGCLFAAIRDFCRWFSRRFIPRRLERSD